jgi:hypothetical protein
MTLAACGSQPRLVELPPAVEGGWARKGPAEILTVPPAIQQMAPLKALAARYDGPTEVDVELFQFKNATQAFGALQSWRPDGARMVRQKNDVFLTVKSAQPDRSALDTFLNNLEKSF